MKTTTLCIALLLTSNAALAENVDATCRDLVSSVRPPLGEGDEGRQYLQNADKAYRDCRGAALPLDVRTKALFKYGIASAARERQQAALDALREAIVLLAHAGGDQAELLIEILDYTAFVESRAALQNDAIAHATQAADLRSETYGRGSAEAAEGLVHLAMVYVTFKDYAKTESLLRSAIQTAQKACGPECDALVNAYAGMETLYQALGDDAQAKKYAALGQNAVPARRSKD